LPHILWYKICRALQQNKDGLSVLLKPDVDLVGDQAAPTSTKPPEEQAADRFAAEHLIRRSDIESFIARVRPLFSKVKIKGFALRQGVHPAIVIGQLQHRGAIHRSHGREYLVKVRDIVTASTLTDGWGQILPNIAWVGI
jgi:HTH-type transcriptional regulator/antitoxin HigA